MNQKHGWQTSTEAALTELWDSVEDAGRDAVGWSMIADFAKHRYESARTFVAERLSQQNSRGLDVEVGGAIVGSVTCGAATDKPDVTDDAAFLTYVADNHSDALRVDSRWRDMFLKRLTKAAVDDELGHTATVFIDKQTGEIVPGVELVRSRPYWKVTKDADARERMHQLLATVQPTLDGFKAISAENAARSNLVAEVCRIHRDEYCRSCDENNDDLWVHPRDLPEPTDRYTQDREAGAL